MLSRVPRQAWVVTFAGASVNLCLGILYAWSVWKSALLATPEHPAGSPMEGVNAGWYYLTDAQATWAYSICGFVFSLAMIPGGRLQDRYGPRVGVTLSGLFLGGGCILAGFVQSYIGLIVGFGLFGGIGMGLGYAATTPAAVRWFGPHKRAFIVGLVVGGYGAAAVYISPLGKWLIGEYGISGSFIGLGCLFAVVIVAGGRLLAWPPTDYIPPAGRATAKKRAAPAADRTSGEMVRTWQFFALVLMFIGSAQAGLLVIANATPMLDRSAKSMPFFASNAWLLASFGGFVNAFGRVGTGAYSDRIGRSRAYLLNGGICAIALLLTPSIVASGSVPLLFLAVGIAYWQYGGGLALMPAFAADFFGAKNMGMNYGLIFIGWGIAFLIPLAASYLKDVTGNLDLAFYLSGGLLAVSMAVAAFVRPPSDPGPHEALQPAAGNVVQ